MEAEEGIRVVIDVVRAIRNIRAERGVDPGRFVEAYLAADGPSAAPLGALRTGARPVLEAARSVVEMLARVRPLHIVGRPEEMPGSGVASAVLTAAQLALPLATLIDVDVERERLQAQLTEAESEVKRLQAKLANEQFRSKAPAPVVAREEEKLVGARGRAEGLRRRLAELG